MSVHAEGLAEIPDLIGKTNLQSVPAVIDIFDHFRGFQVRANQRASNFRVELCQNIAACLI